MAEASASWPSLIILPPSLNCTLFTLILSHLCHTHTLGTFVPTPNNSSTLPHKGYIVFTFPSSINPFSQQYSSPSIFIFHLQCSPPPSLTPPRKSITKSPPPSHRFLFFLCSNSCIPRRVCAFKFSLVPARRNSSSSLVLTQRCSFESPLHFVQSEGPACMSWSEGRGRGQIPFLCPFFSPFLTLSLLFHYLHLFICWFSHTDLPFL